MSARTAAIFLLWAVAIAGTAMLDSAVASTVHGSALESTLRGHRVLAEILKAPGSYLVTVVIALIVWWQHRAGWRAGIFVLLATAISGVNGAIKWMVGRYRPFRSPDAFGALAPFEFHPFPGSSRNLSFPSGHACLAFATAAALGILWPRWRWAFYLGAALVAFERVAENAHWLSDVVAAAALGIGGVYLIRHFFGDKLLLHTPRREGHSTLPAQASTPAE